MLGVWGTLFKDTFGDDTMSDTYCDDCGVKVCVQDDVAESCTSCREVVFCGLCSETEKRPSIHLDV